MHGNVWEWCASSDNDASFSEFQPRQQLVTFVCGGAYSWPAMNSRSASRMSFPMPSDPMIGFRVVLSVDAVKRAVEKGGGR
jgi:formylglycine-generating enzyme required for sulfatase activity